MKKVSSSKRGVRAGEDKRRKIRQRACELAMNRGRRLNEVSEEDVRRAERELLGLQTLPDPDNPLGSKRLG